MDCFCRCDLPPSRGGYRRSRLSMRRETKWRIFSLKELQVATNSFDSDNKLGEGGFGSVYWGQLCDGTEIAVKRLKAWTTKADMEFAVEVEILGRVHHKNLLSLLGYCVQGHERLIVYNFMPNLSVHSHLHGQLASEGHLDWAKRINIARGSAEGIAYLHHSAVPHIIHRDVKASNILLNSNFEAQVADFGFAKLIPEGVSHVTTRVKGTVGYLDPEYAMWGKASESCDVYSFGILLLELISGRKPVERLKDLPISRREPFERLNNRAISGRKPLERLKDRAKRSITEWATPLLQGGKLEELVDPKLHGKYDGDELLCLVQVAMRCAQTDREKRPTMLEVVDLLKAKRKEGDERSVLNADDGIRFKSLKAGEVEHTLESAYGKGPTKQEVVDLLKGKKTTADVDDGKSDSLKAGGTERAQEVLDVEHHGSELRESGSELSVKVLDSEIELLDSEIGSVLREKESSEVDMAMMSVQHTRQSTHSEQGPTMQDVDLLKHKSNQDEGSTRDLNDSIQSEPVKVGVTENGGEVLDLSIPVSSSALLGDSSRFEELIDVKLLDGKYDKEEVMQVAILCMQGIAHKKGLTMQGFVDGLKGERGSASDDDGTQRESLEAVLADHDHSMEPAVLEKNGIYIENYRFKVGNTS